MRSSLSKRFAVLDKALVSTQAFWRIEPFHLSAEQSSPWLQDNGLYECISSLTTQDIHQFKNDTGALVELFTPFIPQLASLWHQCDLPAQSSDMKLDTQHLNVGIPGRKWQQINAMGQAVLQANCANHTWLEWCAGKGYLGQWLAQQSQRSVISFEWQESLCSAGQALADKHDLPVKFVQGDALSPDCVSVFKLDQHAVALHACGDLHAHLIEHVCQQQLSGVTLSPCCYHLVQANQYQPLSIQGQQSDLTLSKSDLSIPLQETVTGGQRVKKHRELEMSYRLGLDSLLKEKFRDKGYISIPSIKKSQLSKGFLHFCQWAVNEKDLGISLDNIEAWYEKGQERFLQMERFSLVQQVFRRPLEMWLVCDKALRLEQAGYDVSLSIFCPREITPRNILIQAV